KHVSPAKVKVIEQRQGHCGPLVGEPAPFEFHEIQTVLQLIERSHLERGMISANERRPNHLETAAHSRIRYGEAAASRCRLIGFDAQKNFCQPARTTSNGLLQIQSLTARSRGDAFRYSGLIVITGTEAYPLPDTTAGIVVKPIREAGEAASGKSKPYRVGPEHTAKASPERTDWRARRDTRDSQERRDDSRYCLSPRIKEGSPARESR